VPDDRVSPVPVDLPIEARLAAAVAEYGENTVVLRSLSLLAGNNEGEDFLLYVGGEHARGILEGAPVLYWPELWGTRALLYVWNDSAVLAVTAALNNQAWRVREMAARVAAARGLAVEPVLTELLTDEVARVRAAAARALGTVGSDLEVLKPLLKDPEIDVRRGAQQAIDALRKSKPVT
jgi:HEAT repeat protein